MASSVRVETNAASPASAIVLTGGPTYAPGGGWTCTVTSAAGAEKQAGGANVSCTGTAGAFTNLNANDPNAWTYVPDLNSHPFNVVDGTDFHGRLTWQVSPKLKVGYSHQESGYCAAICAPMPSIWARACSSETPGFRRAKDVSQWKSRVRL